MWFLPVSIVFICLAVGIVLLRLYTRLFFVRTPGWDDAVIVASLLADIVFFTLLMLEVRHGMGKAQETISPEDLHHQLKALWASIPLYNLTLNLAKISVTLLYMRLFATTPHYRTLLLITLIVIITTGLWMVFSAFFFCVPVHAFWDASVTASYCLPRKVIWPLNAAIQIVTDVSLVVLPMPVLVGLRLPRRQKVAVIVVFALGVFVCATSIVRLITLVQLIGTSDLTRENGPTATWSFIEANVAIICACLPPLRPLLAHFFPRLLPPRVRASYAPNQQQQQREKPTFDFVDLTNPFSYTNTSYTASVTGNCSTSHDGRRTSEAPSHFAVGQQPPIEGTIHVVSELRLQSNSAESGATAAGTGTGIAPASAATSTAASAGTGTGTGTDEGAALQKLEPAMLASSSE